MQQRLQKLKNVIEKASDPVTASPSLWKLPVLAVVCAVTIVGLCLNSTLLLLLALIVWCVAAPLFEVFQRLYRCYSAIMQLLAEASRRAVMAENEGDDDGQWQALQEALASGEEVIKLPVGRDFRPLNTRRMLHSGFRQTRNGRKGSVRFCRNKRPVHSPPMELFMTDVFTLVEDYGYDVLALWVLWLLCALVFFVFIDFTLQLSAFLAGVIFALFLFLTSAMVYGVSSAFADAFIRVLDHLNDTESVVVSPPDESTTCKQEQL